MDLADDVAYSVHDVEDGVVAGRIDLRLLGDPPSERRSSPWSATGTSRTATTRSSTRRWPAVVAADLAGGGFDGTRASLAGLKRLTSGLIGRFCETTQRATHDAFGSGPLVRHDADLVVPDSVRDEIAVLKGVAAHYVMRADDRLLAMEGQRELLAELTAGLLRHAPDPLAPVFHDDWHVAADDASGCASSSTRWPR